MHPIRHSTRMTELRAIIDAYRNLSIEEAEASDAGDREAEAVAELWRLEQAAHDDSPSPVRRHHHAA
ncbi:hypothetical protein TBR22_A01140 [Luteitalea sp. TBR-22]|uniref:hypothetical protein n=1 Tax=Luteitalea sp. TBR-22 TaxID=2802971 RepID=UPI001AF2D0E7|nr:hypothetical protein [Luteitalea sp. TBR-22]BCS30913.1 hypothetical protein TBR22_A01140 [Luteitalea sp. TBR-22]